MRSIIKVQINEERQYNRPRCLGSGWLYAFVLTWQTLNIHY